MCTICFIIHEDPFFSYKSPFGITYLQLFFLQGAVGAEKCGDKPVEETDLPGVRTMHLQFQLGKAEGVTTGLFKGTNGTSLSKHRWLPDKIEELAPF